MLEQLTAHPYSCNAALWHCLLGMWLCLTVSSQDIAVDQKGKYIPPHMGSFNKPCMSDRALCNEPDQSLLHITPEHGVSRQAGRHGQAGDAEELGDTGQVGDMGQAGDAGQASNS